MRSARAAPAWSAVATLILVLLPILAAAHAHDNDDASSTALSQAGEHGHGAAVPSLQSQDVAEDAPLSYFRNGQYGFWILAHIVSMMLAWVVLLPLGIMLSIARSPWNIPSQLLFHAVNALGTLAAFVYNQSTPDLYVNNAHHPLGWVVSSSTLIWTVLSLFVAYGEERPRSSVPPRSHPMTAETMACFDQMHSYSDVTQGRYSGDSGQGSSLFTHSRQNSSDSVIQKSEQPPPASHDDHDHDDEDAPESRGFLGDTRVHRFISRRIPRVSSPRLFKPLRFSQIVLEKFLLLLGFTAICTGFITFGGIARGGEAFSIAAHFVKGAIFFWYGLLTLGRWMGAFTEFGWAWNIRPEPPVVSRWKTRIPSAEFTESFVIWLYGASNVFLERLGSTDDTFSPQDFEHLSITMLFFGGGLFGMLLESRWVRDRTIATVATQKTVFAEPQGLSYPEPEQWRQPLSYQIPLNPMPGLTIMLLGMMMSGHHQASMVSTMMHAQWGHLFTAFALARAATYVTLYIRPPTSHFPSRPPSELVAAFCLTAGGLMFMLSGSDTVRAIEENGLDAMTVFTVTMGATSLVLAWEMFAFAIKGWATTRRRTSQPLPVV